MFSVLMLTAVVFFIAIFFFFIDEGINHIVKAALRDK